MTQEDKNLLLKDLSARLPYWVMMKVSHLSHPIAFDEFVLFIIKTGKEEGIPYLRPMSSMTEEEEGMYNLLQGISHLEEQHWTAKDGKIYRYADAVDWLNEHHFDYRGLIEKGLALEAPEGMYKFE